MTAKEAGASLEGVGVALMVLPNQPHESPRGGGVGNAYEHLFFFPLVSVRFFSHFANYFRNNPL